FSGKELFGKSSFPEPHPQKLSDWGIERQGWAEIHEKIVVFTIFCCCMELFLFAGNRRSTGEFFGTGNDF
ncbi:MAG: hypothetical protein J6C42_02120, partial [Clostridia bacterium]|nr:hypothetical protein [Clostridia bacterium]